MPAREKVRIATCRDGAEAALVRSLLGAHGIHAVVSGEHHASMLGGLAGPLIALDVWVDREDAEQADALIRSLRDGTEADADDPEDDAAATGAAIVDLDACDADLTRDDRDEIAAGAPHWGLELRKRTGVALLLSVFITFGTGHMYARAWLWGFALAAIEIVGFTQARDDRVLGASLVALAVLVDAIGATVRVRRAVREQQLPRARLRR
jgi:hypothetical protein